MTPPPHQDDDVDHVMAQMRRTHRRNQRIIAGLVAIMIAAALWALYTYKLKHTVHGLSLKLARMSKPTPPSPDALTRLHTTLLPDWFIAQSRAKTPKQLEQANLAHQAIITALGKDTVGISILKELHRLVKDREKLRAHNEAIFDTVNQWNAHMDRLKQPWWIDANIMSSGDSVFFYTKSYKVLSDVRMKVGQRPHRGRIVARVDSTNIRESLLGHTKPGQDGAIILADRIYDFTLKNVWPLLHEDPKDLSPRDRNFAPFVLKEAQTHLSPEAWKTLNETALLRRKISKVTQQIIKRRACGSRFVLSELPHDGLSLKNYETIRRYARRDRFSECPGITKEEADTLISASDDLRDTSNLKEAVEALVAFVSRGISIHEARHDADHHQLGGFDNPLPCEPCEGKLSKRSRAELSAYLASFAVEGAAYTALYQACGIDHNRRTPHANAMRAILPHFKMSNCLAPLPQDLTKQAQELEMTFFGRSQMVHLPKTYPARVELYERAP